MKQKKQPVFIVQPCNKYKVALEKTITDVLMRRGV